MEHPLAFQPGKPIYPIGQIAGMPLSIQGYTWLPVNQLLVWGLFIGQSLKRHPDWSVKRHLLLGGLKMATLLGSEWCHNLAHAAVAQAIGKPVDRIRIFLGMPILLYDRPEHPSITPSQHLARSLGGPVCNMVLWVLSKVIQRRTLPGSPVREVADVAVGMNMFLSSASLLPVSVLDGGPVVKWWLVIRGFMPGQAEEAIRQINRALGPGLLGAAALAASRRRGLVALILAFLGALSATVGWGKKLS